MGEIVYEVHGEDHREGWWSELKGEQKSQGQSFEGSVDVTLPRTEIMICCAVY